MQTILSDANNAELEQDITSCEFLLKINSNAPHQNGNEIVDIENDNFDCRMQNFDSKHNASILHTAEAPLTCQVSVRSLPSCPSVKTDRRYASIEIDSSAKDSEDRFRFGWRLAYMPQTECWHGWLLKRSSGPIARWQRRWFELRRQPPPSLTMSKWSTKKVALIHYSHHQNRSTGDEQQHLDGYKWLEVTGVQREPALDCASGAALSIDTAGRGGRTQLMAASAAVAEAVVQMVARRLLVATCFAGLNQC